MKTYQNTNRLKYLTAADLFANDLKQVFCGKTGKWIKTLQKSQTWQDGQENEQETIFTAPEPINEFQLSLF